MGSLFALNSLNKRIVFPFLLLFLGMAIVGTVVFGAWFSNSLDAGIGREVTASSVLVQHSFQTQATDLQLESRLIADSEAVRDAVTRGDTAALERVMVGMKALMGSSVVKVVDARGATILDLRDQRLAGLNIQDSVVVRQTIVGMRMGGLLIPVEGRSSPLLAGIAPVKTAEGLYGGVIIGDSIDELLDEMTKGTSESIVVLDADGRVRASTLPEALSAQWEYPPFSQLLTEVSIAGKQYLAKRVPVDDLSPTVGASVVILSSTKAVDEAKRLLWLQLVAFLFLSSAIASVIAASVAGAITRPLAVLTRVTRRLAAGDLSVRAPARGSDEVADLSQAFNYMAAQLEDREEQLRLSMQDLETRNLELEESHQKIEKLLESERVISEERRQAQAALKESEDRYRRLAEHAPDVIFRFELVPERGFSYMSPAVVQLFGYTPEECYADYSLLVDALAPDSRAALGSVPSSSLVMETTRKDGGAVWIEVRSVPICDDDGVTIAIEGIVRDVTERKQMEQQLLRAQRLQTAGQMAGQVAHDFNNLLGPMIAYPDLIKMDLPDDHPAVAHCDAMLEAATRMAAINEDMLALGRRGVLEESIVDLNAQVLYAIKQMGHLPSSLDVSTRLAPDLLSVKGSPAQLLRVLLNLMLNARESMEDIGVLTLTTENVRVEEPIDGYDRIEKGEYVKLQIIDTGCGIPVEIKEKIFDAFFTTNKAKRRGAGLGLSVVMAIVGDHKGHVDVSSEVGIGTTFSLYLPAFRDAPRKAVRRDDIRSGTETVLVVDDDPLQREVVAHILQSLGYRVETAASGEDALALVSTHRVDLAILDMVMPGMDGKETYRRIVHLWPGQRAIILSGFSESEQVLETKDLGAGCYLRKPVSRTDLALAVRAELDRVL